MSEGAAILLVVVTALSGIGGGIFLVWSRVEGSEFHPPSVVTRRQALRALLEKVPLEDGRYAVRGRWGWYVYNGTLEAYTRRLGVWWRVPLWASTRAARVIAMEAATGA